MDITVDPHTPREGECVLYVEDEGKTVSFRVVLSNETALALAEDLTASATPAEKQAQD